MRLKVYRAEQMVVQVCAFVLGLIMLWWLSLRPDRSSLWVTIAVVLILWSVARLLTMYRLLHVGLIAAVPVLLFVLVIWAVLEIPAPPQSGTGVPPVRPSPDHSARRSGPASSAGAALLVFLALGASCFSGARR